jgi:hypothetical protein
MNARANRVGLAIAGVMAMLGVYIGARALLTDQAPLTGRLWLDLSFAFFFLARAALQYRRSRG